MVDMETSSNTLPRRLRRALRVALAVMLVVGTTPAMLPAPADAQQPAPPPTWQQGRPAELQNSTLAPVPQPPAPTPLEKLQVDKLKLPPGFKATVWAHGIQNARVMTWGSKPSILFVSSRLAGNVYAVVDNAGKREVKVIAKDLNLPNGIVFKDGTLYVAAVSQIIKYENIEANLDTPPAPKVVIDTLPKDIPHGWKYMSLGPDGKLYFNIGAPGNIVMPPETHANIVRINLDGSGLEYVARGVRNSVGHDFHPVTKELYFTNHARDWLGEDVPNDTLHHVVKPGAHFGYPYCHQGDILDPEFGTGRACSEFNAPLLKLGPHVAPNGIRFYTGSMFPAEYKNRAFIAERGSWNRNERNGYGVVTVTLQPGQPPKMEPFLSGFVQGGQVWGRPNYIEWMPDGSMLLSDDYAGAIYHITYSR